MAGTSSAAEGYVEAVIISGPRKGEFITVPDTDWELTRELTPEEVAMLDTLVRAAQGLAESARAAREEMDALLAELRQARAR